jgi:hypothetical protein
MKQSVIITVTSLALLAVPALHAQPTESSVSLQPSDLQWAPSTYPGIEIVWMRGGPKASGPYAFRLKMVPGSHSAALFHPDERNATVGYGDEFDPAKAKAYPAGSFYVIPATAHHFIWAKDAETIVQEFGFGPTDTSPAKHP